MDELTEWKTSTKSTHHWCAF